VAVTTPAAPIAPGPFSQAVKANGMVYASGFIGNDPATLALVGPGVAEQTRQALTNLKAVLEAAGSGMGAVVMSRVYLTNIADFNAMSAVYAEFFAEPYPARATVAVGALPRGAVVEIEMQAVWKDPVIKV
jgi:2-iminobutanoate/2-iminopropanoate deaminase